VTKKKSTEALIEKGAQGIATKTFRNYGSRCTIKRKKIDDAISVLDDNLAESLVTIFEAKESVFKHYLELQAVQTKKT
jgi:CMP-N-acetylneuraminic acid synthetase